MPSPTYAQNKAHIYKWVENNRDAYREGVRIRNIKYRLRVKTWKEIKREFLCILI